MAAPEELTDDQLQQIYTWVDEIPLSRPKRNIARDFSDGVLMAEVIHHYFPTAVDLHNYSPANSVKQKMYNWATLNKKVFRRMKLSVTPEEMEAVVNCQPGMIEALLMRVQARMAEIRARRRAGGGAGSIGGDSRGSFGTTPRSGAARTPARGGAGGPRLDDSRASESRVSGALLAEKERRIHELEETVEFLELKIKKLEQLVRLKDSRIETLQARLESQQVGVR